MHKDDEAFTDFAFASYPRLVRAALLLGCGRSDAEDAAQNALARCYASWSKVTSAADPGAYVYQILLNGIRRNRRRSWRAEVPVATLPEAPGGIDPGTAVPLQQSVRAALAALTKAHREVLVLRYFADLTEHQTAAVLGIAVGTVKSRAARAINALAAHPGLADFAPAGQEETS